MSDRNIQLCEEAIAAFNRGGADALVSFYDAAVEIYDPDLPGDGTYHGHDGLRHVVGTVTDGFEEIRVTPERLIPTGDRVIGLMHSYGRGRDGTEIEIRDAHSWTFSAEGKIVYWRFYLHRDEALSDAGLTDGADRASTADPA